MSRKNILSMLLVKYENNDKINPEIIREIHNVIMEMEVAEAMFNSVSDPKLIEAAIYREEAAKKKFDYLLSLARDQREEKVDIEIENQLEKIEL